MAIINTCPWQDVLDLPADHTTVTLEEYGQSVPPPQTQVHCGPTTVQVHAQENTTPAVAPGTLIHVGTTLTGSPPVGSLTGSTSATNSHVVSISFDGDSQSHLDIRLFTTADACYVANPPDVDIDRKNWDGSNDEGNEEKPGVTVVKDADNNNAPRVEVIIKKLAADFDETELTLTKVHDDIEVYDAAENGNKIDFPYKVKSKDIPAEGGQKLYIKGITESDKMRENALQLQAAGVADTVLITVLWVSEITAKCAVNDTVSPQNANQGHDRLNIVYDVNVLGAWVKWNGGCGMGIELKGTVKPNDFTDNVLLARDVNARGYEDKKFITQIKAWSAPANIPPGNDDTVDRGICDDNPQSGISNGEIYDTDCPGVGFTVPPPPVGTIRRMRMNALQFAYYEIDGVKVRCSLKYKWSAALSANYTGPAPNSTLWVIEATIPGDNSIAFGPNVHKVLTAGLAALTITGVNPANGANNGKVTVKITGTNLDPDCDVVLKKGAATIPGEIKEAKDDGTELTVEFDLTGAAVGQYDVQVGNPNTDQTQPVVNPNAFEVKEPDP